MNLTNRRAVLGLVFVAIIIAFAARKLFLSKESKPTESIATSSTRNPESSTRQTGSINRSEVLIDTGPLSDAGVLLANQYTGKIADPSSLRDLQKAIGQRGPGGLAALQSELELHLKSTSRKDLEIAHLYYQIGTLLIHEGRFDEAVHSIEKSQTLGTQAGMPSATMANMAATLGIIAMRQGEVDNCIGCIGPSSCILPISRAAVHTKQTGSRKAIEHFTEYLDQRPGDLRVRWILNLAYMTLGEYPEKVPQKYLVPFDTFKSAIDFGHFENVAPEVGLIVRGPNQAGGSVFDDFTGDGLPDLFVTSLDVDRGASFFVNRGDGKFEDRSDQAGLADQVYALNAIRADFDNDGHLDVLLVRGGWEKAMRMSLLRNLGNSTFEDVTVASGLGEPIASETAAWGDYDNDGLVDLFVGGEVRPPFWDGGAAAPELRNRCRLYHNEGGGKFVDVAAKLGVDEVQCTKGSAWGDYDGDGRLDLFVSNMNTRCRLYHSEKDGTFRDVAPEMGVMGPSQSFACWFWDYDNDGKLDLYVNDYSSTLPDFVAAALNEPFEKRSRPRLYRNIGTDGFRDVTVEVGLDREMMPMGANFADIDNDGYLDMYLGTGRMSLEALVPNLMFRNDRGQKFQDITTSSGTGHLQKGHGISFADWNCDGHMDLFVEAGGAAPGDKAYNLLFKNPGNSNHWLKVKLVGTRTNRAAIGAQIKAVIKGADGSLRSIHRTVGNNGSFGGNTLVESIGLLDSTRVAELQVYWPMTQTTQTFADVPGDQSIEITEGVDSIKPLPQKRVVKSE